MHDCKYDFRVFVRGLHQDARGVRKAKAPDGSPIYHDVRGNHHKVLTTTLGPPSSFMEGFLALDFEDANMKQNLIAKALGTWQRRWCWLEFTWFRHPLLDGTYTRDAVFRPNEADDEPSAVMVRLVRAKGRNLRDFKRKESLIIGPWTTVDTADDVGENYDDICAAATKSAGTENIMRPAKDNKSIMSAALAGCVTKIVF